MTDSAPVSAVSDPLIDLAKGVWWWVLIRGILAVIFGVIALIAPVAALQAITIVFGAYAIVDGVIAIGHAIRVRKTFKQWGWLLVQGILAVLAGLAALILPGLTGILGGIFVLWTIVIWNIISGVAGVRSAAGAEDGRGKTWGIIAGVLTVLFGVLLGVLILAIPGATILGLIWVVGIYAIIFGVILVATAIQVRIAAGKAKAA